MKKLIVFLLLILSTNAFAAKELCTQMITTAEPSERISFNYNILDGDGKNYIDTIVLEYKLLDSDGNFLKSVSTSHQIATHGKKLTLDQMISLVKQELGNICTYVQEDKLELANETYQCS